MGGLKKMNEMSDGVEKNQDTAQHNRQSAYPFRDVNQGNLSAPLEQGQLIAIDGHHHAKPTQNRMA